MRRLVVQEVGHPQHEVFERLQQDHWERRLPRQCSWTRQHKELLEDVQKNNLRGEAMRDWDGCDMLQKTESGLG